MIAYMMSLFNIRERCKAQLLQRRRLAKAV